jgi:hypothetical protein
MLSFYFPKPEAGKLLFFQDIRNIELDKKQLSYETQERQKKVEIKFLDGSTWALIL